MNKYFRLERIRDACVNLSPYSEKWVVVPLVFAVNSVNEASLTDTSLASQPGTDRFLDRHFAGSLIGIEYKNIRPCFIDANRHSPEDVITYGRQKLWANQYSSRGYREMDQAGLIISMRGKFQLNEDFASTWLTELSDDFAYEDLLVWLYAFQGIPTEIDGWGALADHFSQEYLGHTEGFPSPYDQRFSVSMASQGPEWPTDFLEEQPSAFDVQSFLAPSLHAARRLSPETGSSESNLMESIRAEARSKGLRYDDTLLASAGAALLSGKHLLLVGPPGTGKTELAIALGVAATQCGLSNGSTTATATADWTSADTIGGYWPTQSNSLKFRPGQILEAIRQNHWLVLDEINRADSDKALGQLFTVLSGQSVTLPFTDADARPYMIASAREESEPYELAGYADVFQVSPDWRIVATMNSRDRDLLFELSTALQRRFAFIEVPVPNSELMWEIIDNRIESWMDSIETIINTRDSFYSLSKMPPAGLGPAIVLDVIDFVACRLSLDVNSDTSVDRGITYLGDAVLALVVPQISDLSQTDLSIAVRFLLDDVLNGTASPAYERSLARIVGVSMTPFGDSAQL